jgi:hypothetical protein
MAARSKLTVESLMELGAKRLAEILIEEAGRNRQLKQAVHMALAAETGPSEAGHEVRKRLAQLARSETFVSSEKRGNSRRSRAPEVDHHRDRRAGNPRSPPSCSGSCSIFSLRLRAPR